MRIHVLALLSLPLALTGCAFGPAASLSASQGAAIAGTVHGGQQPIVGAHLYLFAANTSGFGGAGITAAHANSSNSLLASGDGTDSVGTYVLTGSGGAFNITASQYACAPGQVVYMYALGGDPGSGTNSAAGLLAILGTCPAAGNFVSATPFVVINEVSTVAAAYAFAGFATDATHVSSDATYLVETGIVNAFANSANLVDLATGIPYTTTPAGNGTVPAATINTLANILAACINSSGSSSSACTTLLSNATSDGTTSGTQPTDTASAAINIAHFPAANVTNLYGLQTAIAPFQTSLATQPNDFSLGIVYTGAGLNTPIGIAIDASGNAWAANFYGSTLSELSSTGAVLSGSTGYTGGGLANPSGIAIDTAGNVWAANFYGNSISKLSSTGTPISGSTGYTGGGLANPIFLAIDGAGSVWIANQNNASVTKLASDGTALSGSAGFTGGGLYSPNGIAIDGAGNAWITNLYPAGITKLSNSGTAISGAGGYTGGGLAYPYGIAIDKSGDVWVPTSLQTLTELSNTGSILSGSGGYTGGGLDTHFKYGTAIDGAGNVWIANYSGNSVSEFSSAGVALSGSTGYTGGGFNSPTGIAIDGSGDVWTANNAGNSITELIGAAVPVITPIAAGLPSTVTSDGSSLLGTRP